MGHMVDTQTTSMNIDRLYAVIKNFRDAFPDNFKETGMKLCIHCNGEGIPVKRNDTDLTFWQPGNYCDKCKGLGVVGIKRIYDEYICKGCGGSGCEVCNNRGSIDWISNIMKG